MLKDFIQISQYAGQRFDLTQANGGNSSFKSGNNIFIKSSGYYLSDINENEGFAKLKLSPLQEFFRTTPSSPEKLKQCITENLISGNYPSIEIGLHVILGKLVLHTHPLAVNALTCHKDWQKILTTLFAEAILIPYATPGLALCQNIASAIQHLKLDVTQTLIFFLQNHGLIISGNSAAILIAESERIVNKIENFLGLNFEKYRMAETIANALNQMTSKNLFCRVCDDDDILKNLHKNKQFFFKEYCIPSAYIYNTIALEIEDINDPTPINSYKTRYNRSPQVIIFQNNIYLLADNRLQTYELESTLKEHLQLHKIIGNKIRNLTINELVALAKEINL